MPVTIVPGSCGVGAADVHRDAVAAGVLDAAQHEHLGAGGGQLEHLLVGDGVQPLARSGTIRGSAVKTPSTSV